MAFKNPPWFGADDLATAPSGPVKTTLSESERRDETRNVLFNDALNTFYLRLYDVRHMVKDHTDSEKKPAATT